METSNPSLQEKTFRYPTDAYAEGTMTLSGAINKAGLLLVILCAGAAVAWNYPNPFFAMGGAIGGLICAMILIFKPNLAPTLAPVYAVCEGLTLGIVSLVAEQRYPGIAGNAMTLTFATLGLMLLCYRMGLLRATPVFQRVLLFATGAICITYFVDLIMGFFGHGIPMIHEGTTTGIVFSVIVVGIAALNLILDFDMFERQADRAPKYMEWYCGFALLVTLVWLYLEMVRLLMKTSNRR